ncbi:hypothetical protein F5Y16DRAFT_42625 [Xylariaceae sp. FL0255]|nr:hypothetical protein F5Y16DRAFT_42625 [Xylariaceae sp. FL0255]
MSYDQVPEYPDEQAPPIPPKSPLRRQPTPCEELPKWREEPTPLRRTEIGAPFLHSNASSDSVDSTDAEIQALFGPDFNPDMDDATGKTRHPDAPLDAFIPRPRGQSVPLAINQGRLRPAMPPRQRWHTHERSAPGHPIPPLGPAGYERVVPVVPTRMRREAQQQSMQRHNSATSTGSFGGRSARNVSVSTNFWSIPEHETQERRRPPMETRRFATSGQLESSAFAPDVQEVKNSRPSLVRRLTGSDILKRTRSKLTRRLSKLSIR